MQIIMLSTTMQIKRILSWFSVLESTNNVKYAGDGKFIQVFVCLKLSTQKSFDSIIEKIKRVQVLASEVYGKPFSIKSKSRYPKVSDADSHHNYIASLNNLNPVPVPKGMPLG